MPSPPQPQTPLAPSNPISFPPPPPPPPREITPVVRRRSWGQSPARIWLVLALAVTAVAIYYFVLQTYRWSRDVRLIEEGVLVQA